jgi:DNA topoisomerase-1
MPFQDGCKGWHVNCTTLFVSKAGLTYVSDAMPGFRRIGSPKAFRYLDTRGHVIKSAETLQRIQRLAIPPAWSDVWICPLADGHIQAVGRDARKRKQYRYHPRWREARDETKYHRLAAFGRALPKIRRRVARDLKEKRLSRNKVLATVVRLLETTFIRVGNKEYSRQNGSFGLTTLRDRHVNIQGSQLQLYFRGKSGVKHTVDIESPALAKTVRRLRDLPGYELFQYYGDDGGLHPLGSSDVNQYVREAAGEDFTAKDFRTWAGTMLAAEALETCKFSTGKEAQRNVQQAIASVARQLGNTAAVCRKSYIHPSILDAYVEGAFPCKSRSVPAPGLSARENAVLAFLRRLSKPASPMSLENRLKRSIRHVRKAA